MTSCMKQVKRHVSRALVLVALAVVAVVGVIGPTAAMALDSYVPEVDEQPYMTSKVKDTYKAFACDLYYQSPYDVTYRELRYNKNYRYTGDKAIAYYSGWKNGYKGHITKFKCQYKVYN